MSRIRAAAAIWKSRKALGQQTQASLDGFAASFKAGQTDIVIKLGAARGITSVLFNGLELAGTPLGTEITDGCLYQPLYTSKEPDDWPKSAVITIHVEDQ